MSARQTCSTQLAGVGRAIGNSTGLIGANLRGLLIFPLNRVIHFATVDRYLARRFDPQTHSIAPDIDDRHDHIVADDDAFVALP
jgi:hypothetical protein